MLRIYGLIICFGMLYSCGSAKLTATPEQLQLQKEFAETTSFKIRSSWANPLTTSSMNSLLNSGLVPPGSSGNRINLTPKSNYLSMDGAKVDMILPYFGERQMGGGYSNEDSGINYTGEVNNLNVQFNEKKNLYRISFDMRKNTESFEVNINLFQNLSTQIIINSSHRTMIRYDGYAEALEKPAMEK